MFIIRLCGVHSLQENHINDDDDYDYDDDDDDLCSTSYAG